MIHSCDCVDCPAALICNAHDVYMRNRCARCKCWSLLVQKFDKKFTFAISGMHVGIGDFAYREFPENCPLPVTKFLVLCKICTDLRASLRASEGELP